MIEPVTRWFEVMEDNNKKAMTIVNQVKTTWLVQYPWSVESTYERGREFLGHEFKNSLIEQEYIIKNKPAFSMNTQANEIIERIYQVLCNIIGSFNLHDTYVDDADP